MSGSGRNEAPFSGRVWQEIDRTVASVRAANCTARRFLEVDGPYGMGLTSVAGDEGWQQPNELGASHTAWHVARPNPRENHALPNRVSGGTYIVQGNSRPVPLIGSEFLVGLRAVEAYETGCQPLELCRATDAARDVALEEERLLYYGTDDYSDALLRVVPIPDGGGDRNVTSIPPDTDDPIPWLHLAIAALARRGYAGPFALAVEPELYTQLYRPTPSERVLYVDLLRCLFRGGVHMVPVIDSSGDYAGRRGAVVTVGAAYSRLVVGQDWITTYRGRDGVLYRFLIMTSLQLRVCSPLSIQVLTAGEDEAETEDEAVAEALAEVVAEVVAVAEAVAEAEAETAAEAAPQSRRTRRTGQ